MNRGEIREKNIERQTCPLKNITCRILCQNFQFEFQFCTRLIFFLNVYITKVSINNKGKKKYKK